MGWVWRGWSARARGEKKGFRTRFFSWRHHRIAVSMATETRWFPFTWSVFFVRDICRCTWGHQESQWHAIFILGKSGLVSVHRDGSGGEWWMDVFDFGTALLSVYSQKPQEALNPIVTEERYWALFYINRLEILEETWCVSCEVRTVSLYKNSAFCPQSECVVCDV
jgi:hypothetical protein